MTFDLISLLIGLVISSILLSAFFVIQFNKLNANVKRVEAEKDSLSRELNQLSSEIAVKDERINTMQMKLDEADKLADKYHELLKAEAQFRELAKERLMEIERLRNRVNELEEKIELEQQRAGSLEREKGIAIKDQEYLKEQLSTQREELNQLQERFKNEFKVLADNILEEKSKKFTQQNKEQIDQILNPLGKQLEQFQKLVDTRYGDESKERISLKKEVEMLVAQTQNVSDKAELLAKALKNDKKLQGNWGEMILEKLLEQAGLVQGQLYEKQPDYKTLDGKSVRPDIVVHYPDGKKVVIDSKVSLISYYEAVQNDREEDRKRHLNQHVQAIKKHVDGLSGKNYEQIVEGLDFVMMFLPIEPAYLAAIQADPDLWAYAYKKKIMLVGPSNLLISLKMIQDLWQRSKQSKNAEAIAIEAGRLYDKFIGFANDLEQIGFRIRQTEEHYDAAMNKLSTGRGAILTRTEKLKKLGAKTKKNGGDLPSSMQKQISLTDLSFDALTDGSYSDEMDVSSQQD